MGPYPRQAAKVPDPCCTHNGAVAYFVWIWWAGAAVVALCACQTARVSAFEDLRT